jgi:hypothetical protein
MAKHLHIRSIIICDDARREGNGKDILIGVYNGIIVFPRFPAGLRQLVVRIEYEWKGAAEHTFELAVASEDGTTVFEANGEAVLAVPSDPAVISIPLPSMRFGKAGRFNIRFGVNSAPRQVGWFAVREGALPPQPN